MPGSRARSHDGGSGPSRGRALARRHRRREARSATVEQPRQCDRRRLAGGRHAGAAGERFTWGTPKKIYVRQRRTRWPMPRASPTPRRSELDRPLEKLCKKAVRRRCGWQIATRSDRSFYRTKIFATSPELHGGADAGSRRGGSGRRPPIGDVDHPGDAGCGRNGSGGNGTIHPNSLSPATIIAGTISGNLGDMGTCVWGQNRKMRGQEGTKKNILNYMRTLYLRGCCPRCPHGPGFFPHASVTRKRACAINCTYREARHILEPGDGGLTFIRNNGRVPMIITCDSPECRAIGESTPW